ncbi:MAG: hypothetical protein JWN94_4669 [Betaproteobacteria bacterium]|nr:hypothetical protein [Betaproteobacteria bacterium]
MIELFDPVGEIEEVKVKPQRVLETLNGKRVGCIFNQHVSALSFWEGLEEEIGKTLNPSSVKRVYKTNTWAPAPREDALKLLEESDFALVGVGA